VLTIEARKAKRAKARARAAKASQAKAPAKPLNGNKGKSTFSDYARPQTTGNATYRPAPNAIAEDDFMASLLSTVAEPSAESSRKRKSSPEMPSSDNMEPSSDSSFFSANRKRYGMDDEEDEAETWDAKKGVMGKKPRVSEMTIVPDRESENDYSMEVDDAPYIKPEPRDEDDDDEMEIRPTRPLAAASTKINGAAVPRQRKVINSTSVKHIVKPEPNTTKVESDVTKPALPRAVMANGKPLPAGSAHWSSVQDSLLPTKTSDIDEIKAPVGNVKAENVLEEDGSLRIFWLDHLEQDGAIHLVGKVLDKVTKRYISACVTVNGIQRNLFVKPRAKRYCERPNIWLIDRADRCSRGSRDRHGGHKNRRLSGV
jgi:DNA polymerase alpha subunit A